MQRKLPDDLNNWEDEDFAQSFNVINENKKQKRTEITENDLFELHNFLQSDENINELMRF
jgi:hypothetical protein